MIKIKFLAVFLLVINGINAQVDKHVALTIPEELKENANSVIRLQEIEITINSRELYTTKTKRIVTVLNEYGNKGVDASEYYSKSERIKNIEATIFDAFGKEIKKVKKKDFKDYSATNSSTFVSDDRILALSYTPTEYPFTAIIESEVEYKTTAFIPRWLPVTGYDLAIIKDEFELTNTSGIKLNFKENNLDKYVKVNKRFQENYINYSVENVSVLDKENMMPSALNILPYVDFSLETFELEGVKGEAKDWSAFGKWMYQDLLIESNDLPQQTKDKMNKLVEGIENPIA